MSFWTAAVAIVAILAYAGIRIARYNRTDLHAPHGGVDDGQAQREIAELRERVKVLEQITVEGREARAIADQIEKLRDS